MFATRFLNFYASPSAYTTRRKLNKLRNAHVGETAVILCNGPSLTDIDFNCLKGTFCFGLNKINLLFSHTDFRPSCVVAVNNLVIEQNKKYFSEIDIPLFVDSINARRVLSPNQNHVHLCCYEKGFSLDPRIYVSQGGTVTFVAMQLAFFMGFKNVALIGCDHHFQFVGHPHEELQCGTRDPNHFHADYFAGCKWHSPDLEMSEKSYQEAFKVFHKFKRRLVNCSTKTELKTLPRMDLLSLLSL